MAFKRLIGLILFVVLIIALSVAISRVIYILFYKKTPQSTQNINPTSYEY